MKMAFMSGVSLLIIACCFHASLSQSSSRSRLNAHIIQDSRDLPQVDGTFGFLYRTEDGIAHGAVGEPGGVVHGRYTYTDPTGLKVNFNYNAGTRTAPGYQEQKAPTRASQPVYREPQAAPQPRPRPRPSQPVYEYDDEPEYQPQSRPRPKQVEYDIPQPQHRLQPRPRPSQPSYSRPSAPRNNLDYGSYSETF